MIRNRRHLLHTAGLCRALAMISTGEERAFWARRALIRLAEARQLRRALATRLVP